MIAGWGLKTHVISEIIAFETGGSGWLERIGVLSPLSGGILSENPARISEIAVRFKI